MKTDTSSAYSAHAGEVITAMIYSVCLFGAVGDVSAIFIWLKVNPKSV